MHTNKYKHTHLIVWEVRSGMADIFEPTTNLKPVQTTLLKILGSGDEILNRKGYIKYLCVFLHEDVGVCSTVGIGNVC